MYHDNRLFVNVRVCRETTCIILLSVASKSIYFMIVVRWIIHIIYYIRIPREETEFIYHPKN